MDSAGRSCGGGAGRLAGRAAMASRLALGGEDLVERLVELARHLEGRLVTNGVDMM